MIRHGCWFLINITRRLFSAVFWRCICVVCCFIFFISSDEFSLLSSISLVSFST
ncbi:hypothetical protein [Moraxella lacunata]|uniref:hypothetical protein n=1 Tax=Moraxella lacunata TaxID=477 RepID=UPI003EDF95D2